MDDVMAAKRQTLCDSAKTLGEDITHDKGVDNSTAMKSQDPSDETASNQNEFHPTSESVDNRFETFVKLCRVAKNCEEIMGIYNSWENNQIMIDISADAQKTVECFLEKNDFKDDMNNGRFHYVQHVKKPTKRLLGSGAKVTSRALLQQTDPYIDRPLHPDELRCYDKIATVSCLGQDATGQKYILTAGHVFDYPAQDGDIFLSCFKNKITCVSEGKRAFFNSFHIQDGIEGLVDFAALTLTANIQGLINATMLKTLKPIYNKSCEQMKEELRGNIVYKHGAVSGTTCGKILDPCAYFSEDPRGMCFIIKSEDDQPFAEPGDSGALIWNANGVPIGIVSMQKSGHLVHPNSPTINVTYGVRLDWCVRALRRRGIDIQALQVFGSPIPVEQDIPPNEIAPTGSQPAVKS